MNNRIKHKRLGNGFTLNFDKNYYHYFEDDFRREDDIRPILRGNHPLLSNSSSGLKTALNKRLNIRRTKNPGKEFKLDCPKSLSILYFYKPLREKVLKAYTNAREEFLSTLDKLVEVRAEEKPLIYERNKRYQIIRHTKNTVSYIFTHPISRNGAPHLHSHCLVLNTSFDAKEKRFKSLNISKLGCQNKGNALKNLWNRLLHEHIEKSGINTTDKGSAWECSLVPTNLISHYSNFQRSFTTGKIPLSQECNIVTNLLREITNKIDGITKNSNDNGDLKPEFFFEETSDEDYRGKDYVEYLSEEPEPFPTDDEIKFDNELRQTTERKCREISEFLKEREKQAAKEKRRTTEEEKRNPLPSKCNENGIPTFDFLVKTA